MEARNLDTHWCKVINTIETHNSAVDLKLGLGVLGVRASIVDVLQGKYVYSFGIL